MTSTKSMFTPVAAAVLLALGSAAAQAATIEISSRDPAGVGFNDATVVAPVGGNPGTTLGAQRLFVYRHVADIWERAIQSNVVIKVSAGWEALTCDATSAVLGSAGAWNVWNNFPNGSPGTWYPQALANSLAGVNLSAGVPDDGTGYGNVDIKTQFNVNLGNAGCLPGRGFYLGIDDNIGTLINFKTTLLHELGHGLGFSVLTTSTLSGNRLNADGSAQSAGGLPSIWERFMFDNTAGLTWQNMTSAQRVASTINPLQLAWIGPNAVAGAGATLTALPKLQISTPVPGVSGLYDYGTASFGATATNLGNFGALAASLVTFNSVQYTTGCTATGGVSANVAGKVAVIDRGTCPFGEKAQNAQAAGAVGVIIANNAAGTAPALGGTSTTTLAVISVSQADGNTLKAGIEAALKYGSRGKPGSVSSTLTTDPTKRAGADAQGRPLLFTPNPRQAGSSVSHWDTTALPNLLMEPAINPDLTTLLVPPKDLTVPLFKDIGWITTP